MEFYKKQPVKQKFDLKQFIVITAFFLAIGLMAYVFPREDFYFNLVAYVLAFSAYLWLVKMARKGDFSLKKGIVVGIVARFFLLFAIPTLSDDFYRFLFDGHLLLKGYNPYLMLPKDWLSFHVEESNEFLQDLVANMNSSTYFSIYPPLHQLIFGIAAFSGESLFWNIFVLRLILIGFELLNLLFLHQLVKKWNLSEYKVLLYILNPLVIMELTANLHFEGIVLACLLATLYLHEQGKKKFALVTWAAAVGIKLSPLMFGAYIMRRFYQMKQLKLFIGYAAFLLFITLGILLYRESYLNFWQSFRLYQSSFEFNASVYYLIRWISGFFMDYNPIVYVGPFLNLFALFLILFLSFFYRLDNGMDLANGMVWIYLIYLLLQTVVHPWYIIPAFGLSILTKNRVFLVWSAFVFLSYGAYDGVEVEEKWYFLISQYVIVFGFIINYLKKSLHLKSGLIHLRA